MPHLGCAINYITYIGRDANSRSVGRITEDNLETCHYLCDGSELQLFAKTAMVHCYSASSSTEGICGDVCMI